MSVDKVWGIGRGRTSQFWVLRAFAGTAALVFWCYMTPLNAAGLADVQALAEAVRSQVVTAESLAELRERSNAYAAALDAFDELTEASASTEPAEAETVSYAQALVNELAAGGINRDMLIYGRVVALIAHVAQDRDDPDDTRTAAYLAALEINDPGLQASALLSIADTYQPTETAQAVRFVGFALDRLIKLDDPHERSVGMRDAIATALRLGPPGFTVAEDTIAKLQEASLRAAMRHRRALALINAGLAPDRIRQTKAEQVDETTRIETLVVAAKAALTEGDLDLALLATEAIPLEAEQQRRTLFQTIHSGALEKQRFELVTAAAFGIPGLGEQSDRLLDQVSVHLAADYPDRARIVANLILEPQAASEAYAKSVGVEFPIAKDSDQSIAASLDANA
ncbi:MAG: hypothetical protein HC808_10185, partial [Candidatus Competibacteraceae bacterium]|nr:hypothetical protein [Candidatus Competibacteraceae bacterium]